LLNQLSDTARAILTLYWKSSPFILLISPKVTIRSIDNIAQLWPENGDLKLNFSHIVRNGE
ncbi:hypothetical protein, partial [Vibrio sp. Vb2424]|uniref:hypothetical protein n=1 Tax=Vibrio sp. Vb2424 TaxID=2816074 RepID=UPI001A8D81C9